MLVLNEITSRKDIENFFQSLYDEHDLAFHPDDSGDQYSCFTEEQVAQYDDMMTKAFTWADENKKDLYEIGLDTQQLEWFKRGIYDKATFDELQAGSK